MGYLVNFLFWNTGKCKPLVEIAALVKDLRIDVLILAECPISPVELIESLNYGSRAIYHLPLNPAKKFIFVAALPPKAFTPIYDGPGISIQHIKPPIGQDLLLATVHIPSKMYFSETEQAYIVSRVIREIENAEKMVGHRRMMVIGDFNMNPFEPGLIGSEGFHAVMARSIATKNKRVVQGKACFYFYNPMWSLLGDCSPGPPGTYYYPSSTPLAYFWNTFDQVLLRPELATCFNPGDVRVIESIGTKSLLTNGGIPNKTISDHLPLFVAIHLKENDNGREKEPVGTTPIGNADPNTNADSQRASICAIRHDEGCITG